MNNPFAFLKKINNTFFKTLDDQKTKVVINNVVYSGGIKIANVVISFLSVPLLINYLNSDQYGIWITIVTFTSWFTIFDFGLGNGLKNKLIQFLTVNDLTAGKKYVSTTYFSMAGICGAVCLLVLMLNFLIPWNKILGVGISSSDIPIATTVMLVFTLVCMVLRLINNLLHAHQQSYKVDVANFISQLAGFISIWIVKLTLKPSLVTVSITFALSQFFILLILNIYLFQTSYKELSPSIKNYDKKVVKEVTNMGGTFFFIQIAGLIMYMTDNFIIARLFGPADVTMYNVSLKYFGILLMAWGLITTPLWPMITKAYYSKDMPWIASMINKLVKFWFLTVLAGVCMLFLSGWVYHIWIGQAVQIPAQVNISLLLYTCISIFATIMATFINGIGKIKIQAYVTGFVAIVNIPLAVYLSKNLNLGLIGVPVATAICLTISALFAWIQVKMIINNKAKGIWNN